MDSRHRLLWGLAVATFLIGDLATTSIGLLTPGVVEAHPVAARVLDLAGTLGMVLAKGFVLAVAVGLYHSAPREWRIGVPVGLSAVGGVVTVSNLLVLSAALSAL